MAITIQPKVTNSVLQALSSAERRRLLAGCEQASLAYGDVLCGPGEMLSHVYFPNTAIISLLTPVEGHPNVEVGLVGSEGMAGVGLFLGSRVSPVLLLVQGSGTATRMKAQSFRKEIKGNPSLQREINRYLYVFMAQMAQTAACNRHHLIEQRLARWLLMTHDRIQSNQFHLTQEFLAQMLGVRRVGITRAAQLLKEKDLISYRRGNITILDRKGLERASCRCYRDVKNISAAVY